MKVPSITIYSKDNTPMSPDYYSYPDGGISVLIPDELKLTDEIHIITSIINPDTLVKTLLTKNALSLKYPGSRINLQVTYNFLHRQDRVSQLGISCGLSLSNDLLGSSTSHFFSHSYVTSTSPGNSHFVESLLEYLFTKHRTYFTQFHGGSLRKALGTSFFNLVGTDSSALQRFGGLKPHLHGVKTRDNSGKITSFELEGEFLDINSLCLILDDIFDGGYTYLQTIKALRERGFNQEIIIAVPHFVASNLETLDQVLNDYGNVQIYTTDSYYRDTPIDNPNITVLNIFPRPTN